jgi:hypothetical protein
MDSEAPRDLRERLLRLSLEVVAALVLSADKPETGEHLRVTHGVKLLRQGGHIENRIEGLNLVRAANPLAVEVLGAEAEDPLVEVQNGLEFARRGEIREELARGRPRRP